MNREKLSERQAQMREKALQAQMQREKIITPEEKPRGRFEGMNDEELDAYIEASEFSVKAAKVERIQRTLLSAKLHEASRAISKESVARDGNGQQPHAQIGMKKLLTPLEAAKCLQISVSSLRSWRRLGKGPEVLRLSRRTYRYSEESLREFIKARSECTNDTART